MTRLNVQGAADVFARPSSPAGGAGPLRPRAFTILELLVACTVIALLAGILVPSFASVRKAMKAGASQAAVNVIDGACQAYYIDFEEFPPSKDDAYDDWKGSELVVLFLVGYGPDHDNDGCPGAKLNSDDGQDGPGFRIHARGKVYGPYNGADKVEAKLNSKSSRPEFVDAFGNPILYYRYDKSSPHYDEDHNRDPPDDFGDYVKNPDGKFYRKDYVLLSAGSVGGYTPPPSDDITNFKQGR